MGYRLKKMGLVTLDIRDGDARTPQISHRWMEQLEVPVTKTVWLIRHGEAEHNTQGDWGIPDPSLTEKGQKQARALKNDALLRSTLSTLGGRAHEQTLIVSSPLRRALQTSQAMVKEIAGEFGNLVNCSIVAHPDLQETSDSPCDTGCSPALLAAEFPEFDFSWVQEGWWDKSRPGNEQSFERLYRFSAWLAARPEQRVILVAHADVFREMIQGLALGNGQVAEAELRSGGWSLLRLGAVLHQRAAVAGLASIIDGPEQRRRVVTQSELQKSGYFAQSCKRQISDARDYSPSNSTEPVGSEGVSVGISTADGPASLVASVRPLSCTSSGEVTRAALSSGQWLFRIILEHTREAAGDRRGGGDWWGEATGATIERTQLAAGLRWVGVVPFVAEQLIDLVTSASRTIKKGSALALVTEEDLVRALPSGGCASTWGRKVCSAVERARSKIESNGEWPLHETVERDVKQDMRLAWAEVRRSNDRNEELSPGKLRPDFSKCPFGGARLQRLGSLLFPSSGRHGDVPGTSSALRASAGAQEIKTHPSPPGGRSSNATPPPGGRAHLADIQHCRVGGKENQGVDIVAAGSLRPKFMARRTGAATERFSVVGKVGELRGPGRAPPTGPADEGKQVGILSTKTRGLHLSIIPDTASSLHEKEPMAAVRGFTPVRGAVGQTEAEEQDRDKAESRSSLVASPPTKAGGRSGMISPFRFMTRNRSATKGTQTNVWKNSAQDEAHRREAARARAEAETRARDAAAREAVELELAGVHRQLLAKEKECAGLQLQVMDRNAQIIDLERALGEATATIEALRRHQRSPVRVNDHDALR